MIITETMFRYMTCSKYRYEVIHRIQNEHINGISMAVCETGPHHFNYITQNNTKYDLPKHYTCMQKTIIICLFSFYVPLNHFNV